MRFIDFLIEGDTVRGNPNAQKAGTHEVDVFVKHHVKNLKAAGKEARDSHVKKDAEFFRSKRIDDNMFGDPDLSALSRKHEISVKVPVDYVRQEMASTKPKVDKCRKKICSSSRKAGKKNGGKM